jgi:hypothetical protein
MRKGNHTNMSWYTTLLTETFNTISVHHQPTLYYFYLSLVTSSQLPLQVILSQSENPSWCQAPIWEPRPIFPILFDYFFRQFVVCCCGASFLTRSRVCTFLFLPAVSSAAFLRPESHGTHEHSLLSLLLRLPQPGGPGYCTYFPRNRVAQLYPRELGLTNFQSQSYITADSQSPVRPGVRQPSWTRDQFFQFSL